MTELLHRELSGKIIGAYYDVYNGLSHNYPEFIYENAMLVDLQRRGISCTHQKKYQITYKNRLIGVQRLDVLVADQVVVELKVKPCLTKLDKAQSISYVKTAGCQVGLLFNFGSKKPEFERLYFEPGGKGSNFSTKEGVRSADLFKSIFMGINISRPGSKTNKTNGSLLQRKASWRNQSIPFAD